MSLFVFNMLMFLEFTSLRPLLICIIFMTQNEKVIKKLKIRCYCLRLACLLFLKNIPPPPSHIYTPWVTLFTINCLGRVNPGSERPPELKNIYSIVYLYSWCTVLYTVYCIVYCISQRQATRSWIFTLNISLQNKIFAAFMEKVLLSVINDTYQKYRPS